MDFLRFKLSPQIKSSLFNMDSNNLAAAPSLPASKDSSAFDTESGRRFRIGLKRALDWREVVIGVIAFAFIDAQYQTSEIFSNLLWQFWIEHNFLIFLNAKLEQQRCRYKNRMLKIFILGLSAFQAAPQGKTPSKARPSDR